MIADYQKAGDSLWERFNADKVEQKWYYNGLVGLAHGRHFCPSLYELLVNAVSDLFPE
jgi:hypothetical protein